MTYQAHCTLPDEFLEQIAEQGLEVVPELIRTIINTAMQLERQNHLGVSVSLSEQEIHWRTFLQSLVARGLTGVELVISDAHAGLKQARRAVFGGVPWQRCQFHLQQNAQAYVPRHSLKAEVAADIRAVFNARNRNEVVANLRKLIKGAGPGAPAT